MLICPKCHNKLITTNTFNGDGLVTRRRRCVGCGEVIITKEKVSNDKPFMVEQTKFPHEHVTRYTTTDFDGDTHLQFVTDNEHETSLHWFKEFLNNPDVVCYILDDNTNLYMIRG